VKSNRNAALFAVVSVGLAAAVAIGQLRPPLATTYGKVRERSDVYSLPKPEQVVVASLGYRAAMADWLFSHVLIWHGLNFQEKRRLDFAAEYLDAIVALDPTFRDPYYFGDTLIAIQPTKPTRENYVRARRLIERGMDARPYDTELWLSGGQFIAYLAAPWLENPEEQAEWRLAGAKRLAHACEIVDANENIPFNCIAAARILEKAGEREAMVSFLERFLSVTEDDELREFAEKALARALAGREEEWRAVRADEIRAAWRSDLPFVSLTKELVLSPRFDAARCAGGDDASSACATTWGAWRSRRERETR
jgi:tetratricopeptide (TPR) repeat protein